MRLLGKTYTATSRNPHLERSNRAERERRHSLASLEVAEVKGPADTAPGLWVGPGTFWTRSAAQSPEDRDDHPGPTKEVITGGTACLGSGRHLEDAARAPGVTVQRGASVLIRTGWGQHFGKNNAAYLGEKLPGPGVDAARWLVALDVRLTGTDTATYGVRPPVHGSEIFPVHMLIIADNGIYLVENANLEEIGASNAHLFCLVVPPLRLRGASGSPLRMLAITAKTT